MKNILIFILSFLCVFVVELTYAEEYCVVAVKTQGPTYTTNAYCHYERAEIYNNGSWIITAAGALSCSPPTVSWSLALYQNINGIWENAKNKTVLLPSGEPNITSEVPVLDSVPTTSECYQENTCPPEGEYKFSLHGNFGGVTTCYEGCRYTGESGTLFNDATSSIQIITRFYSDNQSCDGNEEDILEVPEEPYEPEVPPEKPCDDSWANCARTCGGAKEIGEHYCISAGQVAQEVCLCKQPVDCEKLKQDCIDYCASKGVLAVTNMCTESGTTRCVCEGDPNQISDDPDSIPTPNLDGTINNPDGSVDNPDGTTSNPDGTTTNPDGSIYDPSTGTLTTKTGTVYYDDGTAITVNGETRNSDGQWFDQEGHEIDDPTEEGNDEYKSSGNKIDWTPLVDAQSSMAGKFPANGINSLLSVLEKFESEPIAPSFTMKIPFMGTDYSFTFDLDIFDPIAAITRIIFSIILLVGTTYLIIKLWSN